MSSKKKCHKQDVLNGVEDFICPITQELPVQPVLAEDGKVYEHEAWKRYVNSRKSKAVLKSPWTQKVISKKVYSSITIRNLIEQAVRNGQVADDLCIAWKQNLIILQNIEELKTQAKKEPKLYFDLACRFLFGDGVEKDLHQAYLYFTKCWDTTSDIRCFEHLTLLRGLKEGIPNISSSRTTTILSWSNMCLLAKVHESQIATFCIQKILNCLSPTNRVHVAWTCDLKAILSKRCSTEKKYEPLIHNYATNLEYFLTTNFEEESDDSEDESSSDDDGPDVVFF